MDGPIIVPRNQERVIDLPLPPLLRDWLGSTARRSTLLIAYVTKSGEQITAATHDFAPRKVHPPLDLLRKRLPAPPPDVSFLRLTLQGEPEVQAIDLPALSPDLADFARGTIAISELPERVAPGETAQLRLTIRNDSAFCWDAGPTGVAVRIDLAGEVSMTPLPAPIAPDSEATITLALPVPEVPGDCQLLCSLVLAPTLPFARGRAFKPARVRIRVAADDRDLERSSDPYCRVSIVPPHTPYLPGEPIVFRAQVSNLGTIRIEAADPGGIRLRARWRRLPQTDGPIRDPVTVLLPYPLEPAATCIIALDATVPGAPGDYHVDVIAERIGAGARLTEEQCDSSPATVTVADSLTLEKAAERAMRQSAMRADTHAARVAYQDWVEHCDTFTDAADCAAATGLASWPAHPSFGVVLPHEIPQAMADQARAWLRGQAYPAWQLHPSDEPVTNAADIILHWDPRAGELAEHALIFLAGAFVNDPACALVYADHDQHDANGRHSRVFLPAPDPFFARAQPQVTTIAAARTSALRAAGIAPDDPAGAGQLLLNLPVSAITHVRQVLFHAAASPSGVASPQVIDDGKWRCMKMHDAPGYAVHAIAPVPLPRVTLVIPTRDRLDLLAACIGSILDRTDYPNFDIIVIDNGSEEPETLAYLRWLEAEGVARILRDDGPFNWSRLNNRAAALTGSDLLCFMNNDTEVTSERWLHELVALACRPEIGVAGPTLWFPNGTMQHVGVVFSARGSPLHPFRAAPRGTAPFYLRSLRTQPAVTGACLVVRRAVFEAVGGFAECFPLGFNDVDFCMRVQEQLGLPSVCTPAAELLHKESASRGRLRSDSDHARFLHDLALFEGRHLEAALADRWASTVAHDARRSAPLTMVARTVPGSRAAARRYRRMAASRITFIHIPKTAGTAIRRVLERALPDRAVLSIGARAVVEGHRGDPDTISRLAPMLRQAEILISHVSHGFGERVGWPCRYATVLRAPRERVRSHAGFLIAPPNAPLRDTPLADWSIARLLRKGIIPGNLMLAKILGAPPEPVGWSAIDGRFPRYAGFGLPAALWHGDMAALAALPDIAPDRDAAKVHAALAVIERAFVFVGLQEQLDEHLRLFGRIIDVPDIGAVPHINTARAADRVLSEEDLAAIDTYNALDQQLHDAIAARPGGLFIKEM